MQFGAALGATVLTTAREVKHDQLRELGAAHTIDYRDQDFVEEVQQLTDGHGWTSSSTSWAVPTWAAMSPRCHRRPAGGDRLAGRAQGRVGSRGPVDQAGEHRGHVAALPAPRREGGDRPGRTGRGVAVDRGGRIRPIVDRRLPMTEAAEAHRFVESSDHFGKVLLTRPAGGGAAVS
ncbi:zinc-binding dehydrogenase [Micromonospora sp. M12]